MALRIASRVRINGAACDHMVITVEKGPDPAGPATSSFTFEITEDVFNDEFGLHTLAAIVANLPNKGEIEGMYLFSWALYQLQVNAKTPAQIIGVWID